MWILLIKFNTFLQVLYILTMLIFAGILIRTIYYFVINETATLKWSEHKIECNETYGKRTILFEDISSIDIDEYNHKVKFSLIDNSRSHKSRSILDKYYLESKSRDVLNIRGYENKEELVQLIKKLSNQDRF